MSQKVSKNKKVIYTYDELNRLKTVTIDWLTPKQTATYNYDDAGRLDWVQNFNGSITDYGYDNANRLTTLENKKSDTTTILASYSFTLDANGNRTQTVQNEPLTQTPNAETVSYTYNNPEKNRLLTANTISFGYDNEGQLSSGYSSTYSFDYEHRLKSIDGTTTFYYDGSGKRLKAVRSGAETRYIYDAGGNLLAEANSSNVITKYYIHGLGLLAMVTDTGQAYTYHFNAVGSTIAMTDSAQNMVNKYSYDPFGNVLNQTETVPQPFKFVGQFGVMTEPNGFYYMRARYYDPNVGRFISEDPIGFEGGDVNLYNYVGANPVNFVDPMGLDWKEKAFSAMGGFWKIFGPSILYVDDMIIKPLPFIGAVISFFAEPTNTIVTQEEEMKILEEGRACHITNTTVNTVKTSAPSPQVTTTTSPASAPKLPQTGPRTIPTMTSK